MRVVLQCSRVVASVDLNHTIPCPLQRKLAHRVAQHYGLSTSTVEHEDGQVHVVAKRSTRVGQQVNEVETGRVCLEEFTSACRLCNAYAWSHLMH